MLDKMYKFLQKLTKILYIILYNIYKKILPLKENKITLASNRCKNLSGNLLWIYNELKNENYNIKILTTDKINVFYNIRLIINMANSKYTIIDDFFRLVYPLKIRKGAKLIQVWHAVGAFKKVGFSRLGTKGGPRGNSIIHKNYTDVILSSGNIIENYMEAFRLSKDKFHALGVPRTDLFFDEKKKQEIIKKIYSKYPILKDKNIILFAPTFRGTKKTLAYYNQEYFDINQIYQNLKDNEILIIKNHPFVKKRFNISKEQSKKIIDLTEYNDINEILLITDLLITDYSSVIFEYALLNKPIIFYVPDLEEYVKERDFYYDFKEYICGSVCKSFEQLICSIKNPEIDTETMKKFKNKFLNKCDGNSTKRFIEYIIKEK